MIFSGILAILVAAIVTPYVYFYSKELGTTVITGFSVFIDVVIDRWKEMLKDLFGGNDE